MQQIRKCLIIDDDQDDQEVFKMCVNTISKDINCETMDNGVDAISMLAADTGYTPDYIFIDVNMPKMNGIACLKVLKNMGRLKDAKFFMYSTASDHMVLEESKRSGADDFLIKPTRTAELKEKLAKIFDTVA